MYKTVTHVIRFEREPPTARVPLLLVHHYKGLILSPEDFSTHLNECLLYTYYRSVIHLLCIQLWAGKSGGWADGLGCWHLKRPARGILNMELMDP